MGTPASSRAPRGQRTPQDEACAPVFLILGLSIALLTNATPSWAHNSDHPGVLLLHSRQKEAAYSQVIRAEVIKVLQERMASSVNVFDESVEGWSGTGEESDRAVLNVLKQRYSRTNLHLLIPIGNQAVRFAGGHGRELAPEASIVYMIESFGNSEPPRMLDATGVILRFEPEGTLQVALQQNPDTRHVVVITGSSPEEKMELLSAQGEFRRYQEMADFQYVTDVTYAALLGTVARLPRDAVVILLNFSQDAAGDEFIVANILPSISQAATRPIYVVYGSGVGAGAVGGRVHDFGRVGRAIGKLAVEVLQGKEPADLPVEEGTFQETRFDWRQMQRWGIEPSQVPFGSVLINHELTAWERYRWWILGTFALLGMQAGLISFLAVAQVRRIRAERELASEVELEGLVSELAVAFVNIPHGRFGERIEHSCNRLLRFFQVDRIALFEFSADKDALRLLYSYRMAGAEAFPDDVKRDELPWMKRELAACRPVLISDLAEIPPQGGSDRRYMEGRRVQSLAMLPLIVEEEVSGILVLSAVRQKVRWSARAVERLQTVSHIFANALDKKRSEQALQESENLKARILDSMISHIVVISRSGRIVSANKRWKDYWIANGGRGGEQSVAFNYLEVCQKAAQAGCRDAERALAGILSVLDGKADIFEMEYDCSTDERPSSFLMVVNPLLHTGDGAVIRHRDITFRTQALAMLRESEARFRVVADSAPVMIWMAGPDRSCNYFNKSWLDFRGRSMEKELGDGWMEGIHPKDQQRCMQTYNDSFHARRPFLMEYRLRGADGKFRWVLENGVPRSLPGGAFAGFIGACLDVTEQKESNEARAQLSGLLITAQEQERASIARELHDHINQRLALLAIELQQMETAEKGSSGKQREELQHLWNLTTEISHDVQTLSHQLHSSQLQHLGLAAGIRSLCQEFSKANEVEAECRCTGPNPKVEENVGLALFRVAQEALRNVSKYSHAHTVQTELHCNPDSLVLSVSDDGIGFDPAMVNGGGLGLISMRERMRLVGGELAIRSQPGGGTRIEARVPIVHDISQKMPPVSIRVERRKHTRG